MDASANVVNRGEAPHRDNVINEQHLHNGEKNPVPDTPEAPQIAICGITLRLPRGISNCQDYWDLLYHGLDARRPIPSSRFNINGFNDRLGGKDPIKTRHGYFIEDDLSRLDTTFLMTKNELDRFFLSRLAQRLG
ncbi:polyketide synthase [Fusarium acutatum]|uniref:Polyketide synthase n=1 Tax=Fusarium acutatum TaxID=78861 RepID=A0A8H4JNS5_9HYPO|nr:polyketide synthase [Fusarium acutatum]